MTRTMLKCKIHRATVTDARPDYDGSITIDKALMDAAGLAEYEQVHVWDISNGNRLVTYVIEGEKGSGVICMNGGAARRVHKGDLVVIAAFASCDEKDAGLFRTTIVRVNRENGISDLKISRSLIR